MALKCFLREFLLRDATEENKDDASFMGPGLGLSSWMSSPATREIEACIAQGLGVVLVMPCHLMLCWGGCDLNMMIMVMVTSVVLIEFLNPELRLEFRRV